MILLLAVAGGVAWWLRPPTVDDIADDYRSRVRPNVHLDYLTSDPSALERYLFGVQRLAFRVPDLSAKRYALVGGGIRTHRGRIGAFAVYKGAKGERVMCQTYYAAPPTDVPADRRSYKGFEFSSYLRGDILMVFWKDGDLTFVLASSNNATGIVDLAIASTNND